MGAWQRRLWWGALWSIGALQATAAAQHVRELHVEPTDCPHVDRQLFAELLLLDLRDDGEVIDRPLTIAFSCPPSSVVIRASDRDGGLTVERVIPPFRSEVGRGRVLALITSELLRVAQWTEPKPTEPEATDPTEIVLDKGPPPEPALEPMPAVIPTTATAQGLVGVGGLVRARFPNDRLTSFGAELRAALHWKGPWWFVARARFDTRARARFFGEIRSLEVGALVGMATQTWWTSRIGWENALVLGSGYGQLKGTPNGPGIGARKNGSALFLAELSAGPRWRAGRLLIGTDVRLGVTLPEITEGQPLGTSAPQPGFAPGLAHVGGALTVDLEL